MGGPATASPPSKPATSSQPAGPSLKKQWDLTDPPPLESGSNDKAKKFVEDFKAAMEPVKQCLLYTKINAEKPKHDAMINKRDQLYAEFPSKLVEINKDESKADAISKPFLDRAKNLGGEANKLKQDTENSLKAWQAKEPTYNKSEQEIQELEKWGDKEFENLRTAGNSIQTATNENKYDEAVKLLDQHLTKLKPVYEQYVKQKPAKEKYDAEFKKIEPQLPKASPPSTGKLAPALADIADVQKQMEAAVQARDYVQALDLVNNLSVKLNAYSAASADLEKQKQTYEKTLEGLKSKLAEVSKSTSQKLATQKQEITTIQGQMELAAKSGDYDKAVQLVNELGVKLDAFETARAESETKKKAYEDELVKLKPRLDKVRKTENNATLGPLQTEIGNAQNRMEEAAKKEDYAQALTIAKSLSTTLDSFENVKAGSVYEIEHPPGKKLQVTPQELAVLKIKVATHISTVRFPPIRNRAEANEKWANDLKALDNGYVNAVIGAVVRTVGGADLSSIDKALANQKLMLEKSVNSAQAYSKDAAQDFKNAVDAVDAASRAISNYVDAIDKGGQQTITGLQVVQGTCFVAAGLLGGAALVAAGVGVMAAGAAAGAGFGILESLATDVGHNVIMTGQKPISVGDVVSNASIKALTHGATGALGAGAGKLGGLVAQKLIVRLGVQQALSQALIKESVTASFDSTVREAVQKTPDLIKGKLTWDDFAVAVVEAFIVGGITGSITAKLKTKSSPVVTKASQQEIDAALQEVQGGASSMGPRRLFAKTTTTGTTSLPAGQGGTDKFGNVEYSTLGTPKDVALVRNHEAVHSFLSPKFKLFRTLRADFRMAGYNKSATLKYIEEALAESYAQLRVNGIKGLPTGIKFPIAEGYVTIQALAAEGAVGTIIVGGIIYYVYHTLE
jgi:hypothetical protein